MADEQLPTFLGLNDKTITDIPQTAEKQRYMVSVAPKAANPGKWVEMPRMPIPGSSSRRSWRMRFHGGARTGMNFWLPTERSLAIPVSILFNAAPAGSAAGYSVFFSPAAARLR